jgi:hypothetical protein
MSTISNLHFEKLNDSSCRITCRQAGNQRAINPDLTDLERKTTALLLLCDILEDNEAGSELLATIRSEINKHPELFLTEEESVTYYFFDETITFALVNSCEEVTFYEEEVYYDIIQNLHLNPTIEAQLWEEILASEMHQLHKPTINDLEDAGLTEEAEKTPFIYFGYFLFFQNLSTLEKYLTPQQVDEIWPRQVFELQLNGDYFSIISELNSSASALDCNVNNWLQKIDE